MNSHIFAVSISLLYSKIYSFRFKPEIFIAFRSFGLGGTIFKVARSMSRIATFICLNGLSRFATLILFDCCITRHNNKKEEASLLTQSNHSEADDFVP